MAKTDNYNIEYPDLSAAADINVVGNAFKTVDKIIKNVETIKANSTDVNSQITTMKNEILSKINNTHGAYCENFDNMTVPGVYYGNYSAGSSADCRDVLIVARINGDDYSKCVQIKIVNHNDDFTISIRKGIFKSELLKWGQWTNIITEHNMEMEHDERELAEQNIINTLLAVLTMQGKKITADRTVGEIETGRYSNTTVDIGVLYLPEATILNKRSINDNNAITTVIAPKLQIIHDDAFWGCHKLESIFIPNCCTSIGSTTFSYCESLKTIIIDNYHSALPGPFYSYDCTANIIYLR